MALRQRPEHGTLADIAIAGHGCDPMEKASLTISSKNYSSWSLRGWLMAKLAGIEFDEVIVEPGDADARAEILLLSPSILVPCLTYEGIKVWDTLAIGEFLNEIAPQSGLLPKDKAKRAHCRSICGEMHSGFISMRQALPMNIKGHFPKFKVWSKAVADIERVAAIWRECLGAYGGPCLFGEISIADAMYAPVVTRFRTYDVSLDPVCRAYADRIWALPAMQEWIDAAQAEVEEIEELEVEF
jgi:glutathione S-transferase